MQTGSAVVIANGEFSASSAQMKEISQAQCLIAVDGGIDHCLRAELRPHLLVGDFDSVDPASLAALADIPQIILAPEKDETDLEVALKKAAELVEGPLRVFGGLGGRSDHLLYNIYLLARYAGRMSLESQKERLFVIRGKCTISCRPGGTVSLLPLNGPVKGISSQGLRWELQGTVFDKQWMSISNICLHEQATITVESGDLLCCIQL